MQHDLISQTRKFLKRKDKTLIKELSKSDIELFEEAEENYKKGEFKKSLRKLDSIQNKDSTVLSNIGWIYGFGLKNFKKAEYYCLRAVKRGNEAAMNNLARMYFQLKQNKAEALGLIKDAVNKQEDLNNAHNLSVILLWTNEIEEALKVGKKLTENEEYIENFTDLLNEFFILLLAKKQYYAALKIFNENPFDLKERLKPVYYALMYFLKDDYPNEYKKMGAELKETVEEIINKVRQWEKDYA